MVDTTPQPFVFVLMPFENKYEDIPFDLKHYHHIVYSDKIADKLIPDLEKRVKWAIEHYEDKETKTRFPLKLYLAGIELKNEPTIEYEVNSSQTDLVFDANNSDLDTIQNISYSVALITPKIFNEARSRVGNEPYTCETFPYGDDKLLHPPH